MGIVFMPSRSIMCAQPAQSTNVDNCVWSRSQRRAWQLHSDPAVCTRPQSDDISRKKICSSGCLRQNTCFMPLRSACAGTFVKNLAEIAMICRFFSCGADPQSASAIDPFCYYTQLITQQPKTLHARVLILETLPIYFRVKG